MKKFILALTCLFCMSLFANTCCICQTGSSPENQIHWFKKGCRAWLSKQKSCTSKQVVGVDKNSMINSAKACEGGKVKLGYVGHWGNSNQLIDFIESSLAPTINFYNVEIDYDQTACTSMNKPGLIENFFEGLNLSKKLTIKGNQVTSTGIWDDYLPHKTNFWAKIDSDNKEIEFPSCSQFENKTCFGKYQKNEFGRCLEDSSIIELFCKKSGIATYRWKRND